jgi:predicted Rossmann fold flavoprotein
VAGRTDWDVVILGAGAAGLFAGIEAGRRGRRTLVIEHAAKPGEKIRISGGGRCNFTNLSADRADRFLGRNPRFALSALRRFPPAEFVARIGAAGIAWHEKTLGQLFCDGSAQAVVDWLVRDLAGAGGTLWTGCAIGEVAPAPGGYSVATPRGVQTTAAVIVATGGKSIPKMGATGLGYDIARRFGLAVTETRPALVPLTFAEQELDWMRPLAGVALPEARVRGGGASFDEAVLFTHRGLSGPAVLQVSSYWREGQGIALDLGPDRDLAAWLRARKAAAGRQALRTVLAEILPERLARHIEAAAGITCPLAELPASRLDRIAADLADWRLMPVGSEGYRTAEVTLGGVDTDGLDARTMAARAVPGLHFIGEVVDITGWLGGYNFQWAWASGWAAGQAV